jgi:uncharacterized protein
MMAISVRDNPARLRYEIIDDDRVIGRVTYSRLDNTVTFLHTEVDRDRRGGGYAEQLVQAALDDARSRGEQVRARCQYVARFIDEHPEYADLLAA